MRIPIYLKRELSDADRSLYNRLITQEQDDMVNALGSGNVSTGDEKWYEYHDKFDELVKQRDAYNRGMMGQLAGEKA